MEKPVFVLLTVLLETSLPVYFVTLEKTSPVKHLLVRKEGGRGEP